MALSFFFHQPFYTIIWTLLAIWFVGGNYEEIAVSGRLFGSLVAIMAICQ
jgi:hypothetical protein